MRYLFLLCIFCFTHAYAQPTAKAWDQRLGGTGVEYPVKIKELPQGGFIMLGWSSSSQSFDKTEANRDSTGATGDYWLVKLDAQGQKIWDHTYGGSLDESPTDILVLADGGFLLAGYSVSEANGDKSQPRVGGPDFWIVRTDSMGNKIWDKTIGGTGVDQLNAAVQSNDGGFFLSGSTLSGIGGDKTSPAIGSFDFWLVKTDSLGNLLWDKTFGGLQSDNAYAITKTQNGGLLMGGYSESSIGFDKSEAPRGQYDFWVIRLNSNGIKLWDKTIGGINPDYLFTQCATTDGGFLLGGDSFSPAGFDKTAANNGADDYWIVKLNSNGSLAWDKSFGGTDFDELNLILPLDSGGFLLTGESYSAIGFEKSEANLGIEQIWMINVDTAGSIRWDKTWFTNGHDELCAGIPTQDGCYLGFNYTVADTGGYKTASNYGNGDIWMAKLCYSFTGINEVHPESIIVFPNPASDVLNIAHLQKDASINCYDALGNLISSSIATGKTFSIDLSRRSPGLFLLEIISGKTRSVIKVIHE
ncbi:hypothetical protein BH11BAC2_BH11BAC2_16320 [soil metagenome]